jgi:hypothetical protein
MPAGFWIPWECGLTKKREILLIARQQGVSPREAAACCMEVWEWAQSQSVDGVVPDLFPEDISRATDIAGIGEAMLKAGWLVESAGGVQFPNWERFNARSAKARLMAAERKRRERDSVTRMSRMERDENATCHAHKRTRD